MSATPSPLRYVVGLDVAKADVQACLSRLDDQQRVPRSCSHPASNIYFKPLRGGVELQAALPLLLGL